jgi:hypothetical protein
MTKKKEVCIHCWLIDINDGPTSQGKCMWCGEKKDFFNTLYAERDFVRHSKNKIKAEVR